MTRRGFTLIEVLIALGLLVLLSGLLAGFGVTLANRKDRITRVGTEAQTVSALFGQIDAALTAADANGSGLTLSETELQITTRRVLTRTEPAEFDELHITFDPDAHTVTAERSRQPGAAVLPNVQRLRFRGYDGSTWGDFQPGTLPQAVEVSIWFEPSTPTSDTTADSVNADSPESAAMLEASNALAASFEDEQSPNAAPDRWRVFALVDTLPEVSP